MEYNAVFRRVLAQSALRRIDRPARTLGVGPLQRQAPLHVQRPEAKQRMSINSMLAAVQSSSYEGVPGRGSLVPKTQVDSGAPWLGPEVI